MGISRGKNSWCSEGEEEEEEEENVGPETGMAGRKGSVRSRIVHRED
jgi:hypothetical protein